MLGIAANLSASGRRRQLREREIVQRLGGHRPLDEDDFTRLEHERCSQRLPDAEGLEPPSFAL